MKKYCYFVTNQDHWFDVAQKLYNEGIAEPVLWFGDDYHFEKARELFGECVLNNLLFIHSHMIFQKQIIKEN